MSAELQPLPLERLLDWMVRERATRRTIFGLHEDLFRDDLRGRPFGLIRRGRRLESPVGVAAGPHTQLAPNLVAAWLCGARTLELKTVQVRDRLQIPRPCIDMADVGYNCEWSQELPIARSGDQYLDAWVAIRLLQQAAGVLVPDAAGFVMDLSVGYDLDGVRSARVQGFLDRMTTGSRAELTARLARARGVWPGATDLPLPEQVADSVTLSTMHGCPPEEIERIARFLLEERGLHTTVKLNPTLLGPEAVRGLLNDTLGFDVDVPADAFAGDPDWDAVVDLVRSLRSTARRCGLACGVKLTNTLACRNRRGVLPPDEAPLHYLSGRALHPLSVHAAARLQEAFGGALDISFAGGADAGNLADLVAADLAPVTICSDLLRPGGYQRLHQGLDHLAAAMDACGAPDLEAFVRRTAAAKEGAAAGADGGRAAGGEDAAAGVADDGVVPLAAAALRNLRAHAARVVADPAYRQETYPDRTIETDRPLTAFDCVAAPCAHTCPTGQDVPEYLHRTAAGDLQGALAVVLRDNPLPTVTGMVCDHPCMERCTRVHLDAPLRIRDVKRTLAHAAAEPPPPRPAPDTGRRVAVVGAGPAGLAAAWHLALAGVRTTVLEAQPWAGGMARGAIPAFRLADADVQRDVRRLEALGVTVRCGERVDRARLATLQASYDAVVIAVGQPADRPLRIAGEDHRGVWPALRLLAAVRHGQAPDLGREVVVIGGGNTAMDAARTAVRLVPAGGRVHLVYRRTVAQMPAAREELAAIAAEGVVVHALRAPVAIERAGGRLAVRCQAMRLGAADRSGRPRPEPDGDRTETFACDAVITAVGQTGAGDLLPERAARPGRSPAGVAGAAGAPPDAAAPLRGWPGVFLAGDALRGADTLVAAMGDGRQAARGILAHLGLADRAARDRAAAGRDPRPADDAAWQDRAARRADPVRPPVRAATGPGDFDLVIGELTPAQAQQEAARCLDCSVRCDVCVSVCPDRANVVFASRPRRWPLARLRPRPGGWAREPEGEFVLEQERQTANLVDLCNQCGNCATFCPTAGAPYRDKPRIALSEAAYAGEPLAGAEAIHRLVRHGDALSVRRRTAGQEVTLTRRGDRYTYRTPTAEVTLEAGTFAVTAASFQTTGTDPVSLRPAAELAVLLEGLADHPLVGEPEV